MDTDDLEEKKKSVSWAQEDLSTFSISELEERIVALKEEIARCEALMRSKESSMSAADAVFKK